MPKKEFFNLSIEKQNKIMEAAHKEFTSTFYEDASVNKIVKMAGISRGSFYCYFENKKDIYLFFIKNAITKLIHRVNLQGKQNIFDAAYNFFDTILEVCLKKDRKLIENICCNLKLEFEKDVIEEEKELLVAAIKEKLYLDGIDYKSDEELLAIFCMIIHSILEAFFQVLFKNKNIEEVKKHLQFHLNVIRKGTNKEGN